MNLDPKLGYGIVVVVVVIAALLIFKGANTSAKAPLPDPKLFNGSAATPATPKS